MSTTTHEALKRRVEAARESVMHAHIGENHRTVLLDLLDKGESVSNGHPDKIQGMTELLVLFILRNVNNDLSLPAAIGTEVTHQITEHIKACPLTELQKREATISVIEKSDKPASKNDKPASKHDRLQYVVDKLVECQWALCVAGIVIFGFAPNAEMIITKLMTVCTK
jgi:hypothetical protein